MVRYPCIPFFGYSPTFCGTESIEMEGARWTLEMSTRIRRHRLRILHVSTLVSGDRLIGDQEGTAMWLRTRVPFRETVLFLIFIDFTLLWRPFLSYSSAASTVTNPLSSILVTKRLQFNTLLLRTCRWDLM